MAYFKIVYYVMDNINKPIIYEMNPEEAKEWVSSGRGTLFDTETSKFVETPQEWLAVVENIQENSVASDVVTDTLEDLQKLYVEKTGKQLSIRYKNDIERIKSKLYF